MTRYGERTLWGALALLAALVACNRKTASSTDALRGRRSSSAPAGIIVYQGLESDRNDSDWRWVDLATSATGRIGYYHGPDIPVHASERDAAWFLSARSDRDGANGALRIARNGSAVVTRYVHDFVVFGISPDEKRAVVGNKPGYDSDVMLTIATVTNDGFVRGETLGVPMRWTRILGWLEDGGIAVERSDDDGRSKMLRVAPGTAPRTIREVPGLCILSHDTRTLACVPIDDDDEDERVVHIVAVADPHTEPRKVRLGRGEDECQFSPDDRTIACQLSQGYPPESTDTFAIDVATGTVTKLASTLGPGLVFSPDGRFVSILDKQMTIVSVDGKQRVELPVLGEPEAWLR